MKKMIARAITVSAGIITLLLHAPDLAQAQITESTGVLGPNGTCNVPLVTDPSIVPPVLATAVLVLCVTLAVFSVSHFVIVWRETNKT